MNARDLFEITETTPMNEFTRNRLIHMYENTPGLSCQKFPRWLTLRYYLNQGVSDSYFSDQQIENISYFHISRTDSTIDIIFYIDKDNDMLDVIYYHGKQVFTLTEEEITDIYENSKELV